MKHNMRLHSLMYGVSDMNKAVSFFEKMGYRIDTRLLHVFTLSAKEVASAPDRYWQLWTDWENKEKLIWVVDYHAPPKVILIDVTMTKKLKHGLIRMGYTTPFYDECIEELSEFLEFKVYNDMGPLSCGSRYSLAYNPVTNMEYEILERKSCQ